MPGGSLTNKWLLINLLAVFAAGMVISTLLGLSPATAILATAAMICPALLLWIYLDPRKGKPKDSDSLKP